MRPLNGATGLRPIMAPSPEHAGSRWNGSVIGWEKVDGGVPASGGCRRSLNTQTKNCQERQKKLVDTIHRILPKPITSILGFHQRPYEVSQAENPTRFRCRFCYPNSSRLITKLKLSPCLISKRSPAWWLGKSTYRRCRHPRF